MYRDLIATKLRQVFYFHNMYFERLSLQLHAATQIMSNFTFMKTLVSIGHNLCVKYTLFY